MTEHRRCQCLACGAANRPCRLATRRVTGGVCQHMHGSTSWTPDCGDGFVCSERSGSCAAQALVAVGEDGYCARHAPWELALSMFASILISAHPFREAS